MPDHPNYEFSGSSVMSAASEDGARCGFKFPREEYPCSSGSDSVSAWRPNLRKLSRFEFVSTPACDVEVRSERVFANPGVCQAAVQQSTRHELNSISGLVVEYIVAIDVTRADSHLMHFQQDCPRFEKVALSWCDGVASPRAQILGL